MASTITEYLLIGINLEQPPPSSSEAMAADGRSVHDGATINRKMLRRGYFFFVFALNSS